MTTVINDVKQLLIKNAKNGDFELNLATGGGGVESKPLYPTITYDADTEEVSFQNGILSVLDGVIVKIQNFQSMNFNTYAKLIYLQIDYEERYFIDLFEYGITAFEVKTTRAHEIESIEVIDTQGNPLIKVVSKESTTIQGLEFKGIRIGYSSDYLSGTINVVSGNKLVDINPSSLAPTQLIFLNERRAPIEGPDLVVPVFNSKTSSKTLSINETFGCLTSV